MAASCRLEAVNPASVEPGERQQIRLTEEVPLEEDAEAKFRDIQGDRFPEVICVEAPGIERKTMGVESRDRFLFRRRLRQPRLNPATFRPRAPLEERYNHVKQPRVNRE